jgi:hypothetical protein
LGQTGSAGAARKVLREGLHGDGYGALQLRIMPLPHRGRIVPDFDVWRNTFVFQVEGAARVRR